MFKNEIMEENTIIKKRIGWKELDLYNKYKLHIENNNNIHDYLINYLFKNNDFFVIKNADFPYYISNYITHKILWFNNNFYKNINIDYNYVDLILKKYIKNKKYIVFKNIFNNQSIKNITHFHFFIINI